MTPPFTTFSIEVTEGKSENCYSETYYRLKQLHHPLTEGQMASIDRDGYLGSGQELVFDLGAQPTSSSDGINFYYTLLAIRKCDSSG